MLVIGTIRHVDFRLADGNGNPVTGMTLAIWGTAPNTINLWRNDQPCADALSPVDYGNGLYTITYLPSSTGHDLFMLYDSGTDTRVLDQEDIVSADFAIGGSASGIVLTQNYGGTNALQATNLAGGPASYELLVFLASDWTANRRADANAVGITALDSSGNWTGGLTVGPGVYDIVVRNSTNTYIIAYNLNVQAAS